MQTKAAWSDRLFFKIFNFERSYSQCGEDKILKHLFDSLGRTNISYLDVGTNHPIIHNNTFFFYRQGSSGVCIEPNPELAKQIRRTRPRDVCLNIGMSNGDEDIADFYTMSSHSLSTFSKNDAIQLEKNGIHQIVGIRPTPIRNINSVITEYFSERVDLVSIDVEGWNEDIVKGFDFQTHRPLCFCVETLTFSESNTAHKLEGIVETFGLNDYRVYADTHINTIFLDDRG